MVTDAKCTSCGTDFLAGARFCRQCGQPVPLAQQGASVTEGTTRVLEKPPVQRERGAETNYLGQRMTGPAYMAPSASAQGPQVMPNVSAAQRTESSGKKYVWIIVVGVLGIAALLSIVTLALIARRFTHVVHIVPPVPPPVTQPAIPPPLPNLPPVAPPAPPAPPTGATAPAGVDSSLFYPGAQTTMTINRGSGPGLIQLHTNDSFDKVVAWYTAQLKPEKTVTTPKLPGVPGATSILKGQKGTAIITGAEDGTNIMLKTGTDSQE